MKRNKSKLFFLLLLFVISVSSISVCSTFAAETKTISVTLKTSKKQKLVKKSVTAGKTVRFKVKYKKLILADQAYSIKSSNPAVASVAGNGTLLTKKAGTTTVTFSYKKRGAKIRLTVKKAKSEESNKSNASLEVEGLPEDVTLWDEWLDSVDNDEIQPISESELATTSSTSSSSSSSSSSVSSLRSRLVSTAKSYAGVLPYVYGGNSLTSGTDCSGFIHLIYAKFGMSVPRTAAEFQARSNISYKDLQPGDVVCYKNGGHVAIYIGNDQIVHAKGSQYGTCIDSMWYHDPTGYVRFIND